MLVYTLLVAHTANRNQRTNPLPVGGDFCRHWSRGGGGIFLHTTMLGGIPLNVLAIAVVSVNINHPTFCSCLLDGCLPSGSFGFLFRATDRVSIPGRVVVSPELYRFPMILAEAEPGVLILHNSDEFLHNVEARMART